MHDIKLIRENPEAFQNAIARRGVVVDVAELLSLDLQVREVSTKLQTAQTCRNEIAKRIAESIRAGDNHGADVLKSNAASLKVEIPDLERDLSRKSAELEQLLLALPNQLNPDVPTGSNESDNEVVKVVGVPNFAFEDARQHFDLDVGLDFDTAAKISGSRFAVLRGQAAKLHRRLGQFMLDELARYDYEEVIPPLLVKREALEGTGQLPKFEEDLFKTTDDRWLIPTAEVSLTNMVREQILSEADLPIRLTALTPCFRSEAGAAGRDTRGLIRQHQFEKVEMVSITTPEQALLEHERMTCAAEDILDQLGLVYRRVLLCSGDTGFSAAKTYDLEVYLPGQGRFVEISSCSWCTDFQARRMNTRYRPNGSKGTQFVHTLNGSGVAVGRALVAVLETYQQSDGTVAIPEVLKQYL